MTEKWASVADAVAISVLADKESYAKVDGHSINVTHLQNVLKSLTVVVQRHYSLTSHPCVSGRQCETFTATNGAPALQLRAAATLTADSGDQGVLIAKIRKHLAQVNAQEADKDKSRSAKKVKEDRVGLMKHRLLDGAATSLKHKPGRGKDSGKGGKRSSAKQRQASEYSEEELYEDEEQDEYTEGRVRGGQRRGRVLDISSEEDDSPDASVVRRSNLDGRPNNAALVAAGREARANDAKEAGATATKKGGKRKRSDARMAGWNTSGNDSDDSSPGGGSGRGRGRTANAHDVDQSSSGLNELMKLQAEDLRERQRVRKDEQLKLANVSAQPGPGGGGLGSTGTMAQMKQLAALQSAMNPATFTKLMAVLEAKLQRDLEDE